MEEIEVTIEPPLTIEIGIEQPIELNIGVEEELEIVPIGTATSIDDNTDYSLLFLTSLL